MLISLLKSIFLLVLFVSWNSVSCAHLEPGFLDDGDDDERLVKAFPKEWSDPLEMFPQKREKIETKHDKTEEQLKLSKIYYQIIEPPLPAESKNDHLGHNYELNHHENTENAEPNQIANCVQKCEDTNTNIFLQRFINHILLRFTEAGSPSTSVNRYNAVFELKKSDENMLMKFVQDASSVNNMNNIIDRLEEILISVNLIEDESLPTSTPTLLVEQFEQYFGIDITSAALIALIVLCVIASISIEFLSNLSWGTQLRRLLILTVLISFPWTFVHEYKLAVAEHQTAAISAPKHCSSFDHDSSYIESMTQSLGGIYRYYFSTVKDPCREYHERFLIDPLMKVPPTKIIAVTLTKLILEPLSHAGTTFSITFKNMFSELPVQLWIPAFVFIFVFILSVLLMTSVVLGYSWSLSLPFWTGFQITPSQPAVEQAPLPALDNCSELKALKQQLKDLHAVLEIKDRPPEASSLRQRAISAPQKTPQANGARPCTTLPYPPEIQSPLIPEYNWNKLNNLDEKASGDHVERAPPYPLNTGLPPPPVFEDIYPGNHIERNLYQRPSTANDNTANASANDCYKCTETTHVLPNDIDEPEVSDAKFVTECLN